FWSIENVCHYRCFDFDGLHLGLNGGFRLHKDVRLHWIEFYLLNHGFRRRRRNLDLRNFRRRRRRSNRDLDNWLRQFRVVVVKSRFHLFRIEEWNHDHENQNGNLNSRAYAPTRPVALWFRKSRQASADLLRSNRLLPSLAVLRAFLFSIKANAQARGLCWWICNHRCHPRAASV